MCMRTSCVTVDDDDEPWTKIFKFSLCSVRMNHQVAPPVILLMRELSLCLYQGHQNVYNKIDKYVTVTTMDGIEETQRKSKEI